MAWCPIVYFSRSATRQLQCMCVSENLYYHMSEAAKSILLEAVITDQSLRCRNIIQVRSLKRPLDIAVSELQKYRDLEKKTYDTAMCGELSAMMRDLQEIRAMLEGAGAKRLTQRERTRHKNDALRIPHCFRALSPCWGPVACIRDMI